MGSHRSTELLGGLGGSVIEQTRMVASHRFALGVVEVLRGSVVLAEMVEAERTVVERCAQIGMGRSDGGGGLDGLAAPTRRPFARAR
ncbi:MAG: hypothetical protein R2715_08145 [Ilumatobacteraceae bacterium]